MTNGHVIPDEVTITETGMPLGYLYSTWNVEDANDVLEEGHYDEEQQVWVLPDGVPTMGTYTKTRTSGANCGDCVTDDACF
jgi:hypothetical protein